MSTKTNFKRVALVAVASLGLGVLTSVAPANAAYAAMTLVETGSTAGVCLADTAAASTSARYMSVGGVQTLTATGTGAGETITISGSATFTDAGTYGTLNAANTVWTSTGTTGSSTIKVKFNGTGAVQLTFDDSVVADQTLYFLVQPACGSGYSASTSYARLATSAATAASNIDAVGASKINYNAAGQYTYLNIDANTAYTLDAATSTSVNIATVTGGCKINFTDGTTSFSAGKTTDISTGTGADTDALIIIGDNTPRTCTVTETLDGVVIATKTVYMYGDVASLTVDADSTKIFAYGSASATLNLDSIVYYAKDSAGNVVKLGSAPSLSGTTNGFTQVVVADGTSYPAASATTNGFAALSVDATSVTARGAGSYTLKTVRPSDGVAVYSTAQAAQINKTTYTYTASWDKASYVSGEIMTLTISAKDSAGNPVYDGYTIGTNTIGVGGTTTLSTISTTDAFLNGEKKYKFSAGATASGYGWTVGITNGSAQSPLTGTINITSGGGVSNADVLKAIVSLIASINKQIAALQKALLKK